MTQILPVLLRSAKLLTRNTKFACPSLSFCALINGSVARQRTRFIKTGRPGEQARLQNFQNEAAELVLAGVEFGEERGRGRQYIRWLFDRRLKRNKIIMEKLKDNINRTFYMRHTYAYVPVNNEKRQRSVYYKMSRGSQKKKKRRRRTEAHLE